MERWSIGFGCLLFVASHLISLTHAANVALFKPARANATCGFPAEKYYSILERRKQQPRDRILSTCDASNESLSHNASRMVDGKLETWWQSPASVDKVAITIDLRGEHQKVRNIAKSIFAAVKLVTLARRFSKLIQCIWQSSIYVVNAAVSLQQDKTVIKYELNWTTTSFLLSVCVFSCRCNQIPSSLINPKLFYLPCTSPWQPKGHHCFLISVILGGKWGVG